MTRPSQVRGSVLIVVVAVMLLSTGGAALAAGGDYVVTSSTGAVIVPGTTDIGNHCDDCTTFISFPFDYQLYDTLWFGANVGSNGTLTFMSSSSPFENLCLPTSSLNHAIVPFWDDLLTNAGGAGVLTSVSGSAPNRIFNIEWRVALFASPTLQDTSFEVRLYEGQQKFEFIYGPLGGDPGSSATVGVQKDIGSQFTQHSCNTANVISPGLKLTFTRPTTAATLAAFEARTVRAGVLVRWRTGSEAGLLGFNVFRSSANGVLRKVNRSLIFATTTLIGERYSLLDRTGGGRVYRLQRVNLDGTRTWAGLTTAWR